MNHHYYPCNSNVNSGSVSLGTPVTRTSVSTYLHNNDNRNNSQSSSLINMMGMNMMRDQNLLDSYDRSYCDYENDRSRKLVLLNIIDEALAIIMNNDDTSRDIIKK